MEIKPGHKHRLRTDHKHRSRDDHNGNNKSEQRPRRSGGHKKKKRVMVAGANDIDSSSCYSSSSSSDEDENRYKGKRSSKNINSLCFDVQVFCGMAHSFVSKKCNKDDSDSDPEEEVGGMEGFWLSDSGCSRHMTGDQRWFSSLTPVMTKEYITFGDNGKGRLLSMGTVKVSEFVTLRSVSLVKSLGYNLLLVFELLDEGFEVHFKIVVLVFWILEVILCARSSPRVRFSEPIFFSVLALLVVSLLVFRRSFGNGIGD
jgi:hypothetical protein